MRLAKYLAHGGVASRRRSEVIIADGRVTVGGETVTDPARDVDSESNVRVDGKPIQTESREVWMVHKPIGVVSTAREPGKRRAVVELVDTDRRLYPVGRLDADSSGLILLANDGAFANRMTHPRYEVPKTYRVELRAPPRGSDLQRLRDGIKLQDGLTLPAEVRRHGDREIEITIREGRNRQVRRMIGKIGNDVESLVRVRFGSLALGDLPRSQSRRLSRSELTRLWKDAGL